MRYGVDFTISTFKRRHHGSYRGDHGPRKRRKLKLKRFKVEYTPMRTNRYNCDLTTREGMRENKRLNIPDKFKKNGKIRGRVKAENG